MSSQRLPAITAAAAAFALVGSIQASRGAEGLVEVAPPETAAFTVVARQHRAPIEAVLAAEASHPRNNDYPTSERADYVIGCMAANGNTREALLKCSCAIDTIAGLMPYSDYERAETALSLQLGGGVGGRIGLFRDPPQIKAVIEELRRAQAEANLQCR
jgi:hypothetical protein